MVFRLRLPIRTYDARPCGPLVRVDELTRSRQLPHPPFIVRMSPLHGPPSQAWCCRRMPSHAETRAMCLECRSIRFPFTHPPVRTMHPMGRTCRWVDKIKKPLHRGLIYRSFTRGFGVVVLLARRKAGVGGLERLPQLEQGAGHGSLLRHHRRSGLSCQ